MRKEYYKSNGLEVFEIIEHFNLNFFLGNVVKYICRCGKKPGADPFDDLEKAKTYIEYEISRLQKESNKQASDLKGLGAYESGGFSTLNKQV